jgi:hypothetical protein
MCFSPIASFTASAVLGAIGIATLSKIKTKEAILFAAIPLLFGIQQFSEGFLWLALLHHDGSDVGKWLILAFGFFAGIIWPVYVPLSILLLETQWRAKQLLGCVTFLGLSFAAYVMFEMLHVDVTAHISNSCILYDYPKLTYDFLSLPLYVIATCVPFFVSSHHQLRKLGFVNLAAFIVAYSFYNVYLISVWCFFAAIVSGLIYFYFHQAHKASLLAIEPL